MPIELPPQPPARIAPLRGDDVFSGQKAPKQGRQEKPRVSRSFTEKGFSSLGQATENTTTERFNDSRLARNIRRGFRGQRGQEMGSDAMGNILNTELTPDLINEAVGVLGTISENLGGKSFIDQGKSSKEVLRSQVRGFTEGVENLATGYLNLQRLKELAQLDFSGPELKALQPLTDGLSERQLGKLRKEIRGLSQSITADNFDISELKQSFGNFLETTDGKKLANGLLIVTGLMGLAAIQLGVKDKRVKIINTLLALTLIAGCVGIQTIDVPTATATVTATATAEITATSTPEIADIITTPQVPTEGVGFVPPNFPPKYQETGSGGPLPEANPLSAGFNRSRYVLLTHEGINISEALYSTYEQFVEAIDLQAKNANIDVIQSVSIDGTQTLSIGVKTYADGSRMFIWLADADNNLLSARPDIPPSSNSIEGEVKIPKEFKDYLIKVLPGEDGNFYTYLVGADGKAVAWTWATDGYVDSSLEDNQVVGLWHMVDADGTPQFDKNVIFGDGGAQVVGDSGELLFKFDYSVKLWKDLPSLPSDIQNWIVAHKDFNWQKLNDGYGLNYKSTTGEVIQIPVQINVDGTAKLTIDDQELVGQVQIKDDGNLLINVADGRSFTFQNGVLEEVYTGIGGEAFITNSEVQSLASKLTCESATVISSVGCFKDIPDSYGESYFRFVSTGEAEEIETIDPVSGKKVLIDVLYVVSQNGDKINKGFIVPLYAQSVFKDTSVATDYNASLLSLYGPTGIYPTNPTQAVSVEVFQDIAPKGSKFQIAFTKVRPPDGEGGSATWIVKYLFSQPSYVKSLIDFSKSYGGIVSKDLILFATRWQEFAFW